MDLKVALLLFIFGVLDFGLCAPMKDRTDPRLPPSDGNLNGLIMANFDDMPGDNISHETDANREPLSNDRSKENQKGDHGEDDDEGSDNNMPPDPTETPSIPGDDVDVNFSDEENTPHEPEEGKNTNPGDGGPDGTELDGTVATLPNPTDSGSDHDKSEKDDAATEDTPIEPEEKKPPPEEDKEMKKDSNTEPPAILDDDADLSDGGDTPPKDEENPTPVEDGATLDSKEETGDHASEAPPEADHEISDNDQDNREPKKINSTLTTDSPGDGDIKNGGDSPISTELPHNNNDTVLNDENRGPNTEDTSMKENTNGTSPDVPPETGNETPKNAVITTRSIPDTSRTPPLSYYTQYSTYNPYSRMPPPSSAPRYPTTGMYPYTSYSYPMRFPSNRPYIPSIPEVPTAPDDFQTTGGNLVQTEAETTAEIETTEVVTTTTVPMETTKAVLVIEETTTTPATTTQQPTTQPVVTTTTSVPETTKAVVNIPVDMPGMPPAADMETTDSTPEKPDKTGDDDSEPKVTESPVEKPKEEDKNDEEKKPEKATAASTPEEEDHSRIRPPVEETGREGGSNVPDESDEEAVKPTPSPTTTTKPVFNDITATTAEPSKGLLEKIKKASEDVVKQFGALKVSLVLLVLIAVSFISIFCCCKLCKKKGYRMRQRRLKEYGQEKEFLLRDRKRSDKYNNDTVTLLEGSSEDEF